jgi:hypothetical protein
MSQLNNVSHWLIRVGDGKHLFTSAKFGIWGVDSTNSNVKSFIGLGNNGKNAKESANPGDILWFIKGGSGGLAVANAVFSEFVLRQPGITRSNEELGWHVSLNGSNGGWDYEVKFINFTEISDKKILTEIKAACPVRRYNKNCKVELPRLYESETHIISPHQNSFETKEEQQVLSSDSIAMLALVSRLAMKISEDDAEKKAKIRAVLLDITASTEKLIKLLDM